LVILVSRILLYGLLKFKAVFVVKMSYGLVPDFLDWQDAQELEQDEPGQA